MFLIAILMALLTSRRLLNVDGVQLHYSEVAPLDTATLNDYPELMGILENLLNEDGGKCLDMSVDCSEFPAGACEAISKENDIDLPKNYCQKVICCTEEIAREKIAFTSEKSKHLQLSKSEQYVNDDIGKTNHGHREENGHSKAKNVPHYKNSFFDSGMGEDKWPVKNGTNRIQQTKSHSKKHKTKSKPPKYSKFQNKEQRVPRKLPEPEPNVTATTVPDQMTKPSTVTHTTEQEYFISKIEPPKTPPRRKPKKSKKPSSSKFATTVFPPTTSQWEVTTVAGITDITDDPESTGKAKTPKDDNESKSTTVIKDFTTPKSFRQMWREKGNFPQSVAHTPQESQQQRYEVEQNYLELCGAIAAHAGSPDYDLKGNAAICYEGYTKPQRGRSRSKSPSRKVKGSRRKEGPAAGLELNLYKPRGWAKKPVRPLKEPSTHKRPRQRQQFPTRMYPYPKRPSHQRPFFPGESETQEDYTPDECDDESSNSNGDSNYESQLNSYSDNLERDPFAGAVNSYDTNELNRNSLYDELDDADFDRMLNEGYDSSGDNGLSRLSGPMPRGGKSKKPPSIYLSNIVKPSRGRKVSVPGHDFRELRLFGKFYNHRGELCEEASQEKPKLNGPQADSASSTLEDSEDLAGRKRKFRLKEDQDEVSSDSVEDSKSYNKYKGRQRGKERQRDGNARYSNNFT